MSLIKGADMVKRRILAVKPVKKNNEKSLPRLGIFQRERWMPMTNLAAQTEGSARGAERDSIECKGRVSADSYRFVLKSHHCDEKSLDIGM